MKFESLTIFNGTEGDLVDLVNPVPDRLASKVEPGTSMAPNELFSCARPASEIDELADLKGIGTRAIHCVNAPNLSGTGVHFRADDTPALEEQGLAPYFDFIGGASMDESRDTKTEVVRYVLTQPCVQGKRVLMVGDRNDDMRGAADCGLDAAGALYGYGSREELEPFGPVLLAESCEELTDKLLACRANG